jgi:HTTM domain/Vitamin K-dependent gamma-carboxylase, lumenal domain
VGSGANSVVSPPQYSFVGFVPFVVSSSADPKSALLTRLLTPVDLASLVFFRTGFGAIIAWWAWDYLTSGRVRYYYVEPRFHFTWYPLDWVHPWPGAGMYLHFLALVVAALAIAAGCCYRLACLLFAAGFTYVFLLDATNYQNHYYLIALLSVVLAIIPANRAVSVDAHFWPAIRNWTVPAWALWLVRFHIALPYFFGGVAKLDPDWLSGLPMRQMLAPHATLPPVGPLLSSSAAALFFAWGGMIFDLGIVPLLLWKKTRAPAFVLCVLFHAMNSVLFQIHVFPWFMIFASTIFFEPDWPRRVLGGQPLNLPPPEPVAWQSLGRPARIGFALLAAYCVFHLWWPLRHHLYAGDVNWTERGHYFSWRMMLRNKTAGVRYYLTDPAEDKTWHPDLRPYLNAEQAGKFTKDPEMILHLAQFLADEYRREKGRPLEVRALVLTSLNGRKPQLFLDPQVNLANEPRGFHSRPWIKPLTEPLRDEPWSLPLSQWEQHIDLPPLPAVARTSEKQTSATPTR